MTQYSGNIYSGFIAATSAAQSASPVQLARTHRFTQPAGGGTAAITQTGTLPPLTQNLTASIYILANSSATVSDKITVSAAGVDLITISSFGSSQGYVANNTVAGKATITVIGSACANVAAPATNQTNGGEIPYSITLTPVSASRGDYQVVLQFNRKDSYFPA